MCRLVMIAVLGFTLTPLRAADAENRTTTPVADALDWYSVWEASNSGALTVQTCRGELRANRFSFRCDPLSVVAQGGIDDSGRCSITVMKGSFDPEEGLRVPTLEIGMIVPRPTASQNQGQVSSENSKVQQSHEIVVQSDARQPTRPPQPRGCGELPLKEGTFEIAVTVRSRQVNKVLSVSARDAALKYFQLADIPPCLLRFPNVKTGDPFFHVYQECQGVVDAVLEFRIDDGQVADSAQWTYTPERTGLPAGAELRRNRPELWFGVSRPEERAPTAP